MMKSFAQHLTEKQNHVDALTAMIKKGKFGGAKELLEYLRTKEYIQAIGGGTFSVVFERYRGGQFVLKVPHRESRDPWPLFAQLCGDNPNPLFPRVQFYWEFSDLSFCAFIERLRMTDGHPLDVAVHPIANELYNLTRWNGDDLTNYGPFGWFSLLALGQYFRGEDQDLLRPYIRRFAEAIQISPDDLFDFIEQIRHIPGAQWDLHSGNVGYRGKQLVLFDPIWNP